MSNHTEQVKMLIKQLKESFSATSVEWCELAEPINKSTEILRGVLRISALFPTLRLPDDALHETADSMFENNVQNIDNILQFCTNSLSEIELNSIRCSLEEFLPELYVLENVELSELKPNSDCEQNLCALTSVMDTIGELLASFKAAFSLCKQVPFHTQEFTEVTLELRDIIVLLESKSATSSTIMGRNRFSVVLFNALNRPLKIVFRALWLLFTFPAIECLKYDVLLTLCQNAVCICVCASGVLIDFAQFFLKDFVALKVVGDELIQKCQLVRDYCSQMLEKENGRASILEELSIAYSSDVSEESQISSDCDQMLEQERCDTFIAEELGGADCINVSEELQKAFDCNQIQSNTSIVEKVDVGNSVDISEGTQQVTALRQNSCNTNFIVDPSNETKESSELKATSLLKAVNCTSDDSAEESDKITSLKSTVDATDTIAPQTCFHTNSIADTSNNTKKTFGLETTGILKNLNQASNDTLEQSRTVSALRSTVDATDTTVSQNFRAAEISKEASSKVEIMPTLESSDSSSQFLELWDLRTDLLPSKHRKTLDKVILNYKHHTGLLSFTVKISELEFQVRCKICDRFFLAEIVKRHLQDECKQQNPVKKSEGHLEASTVVPFCPTSSTSPPLPLLLDISEVNLNSYPILSLSQKMKNVLRQMIGIINYHHCRFLFAVKITESELKIVCKICGDTLLPIDIKEHILDRNHEWNIYRKFKTSPEVRIAVPEISAENWNHLKLSNSAGNKCWCNVCACEIGTSIYSWIQHFNGFCHRMKMENSQKHFMSGKTWVSPRDRANCRNTRTRRIRSRDAPYSKPKFG